MSFFKKSLSIQNTAAHVKPRFQSDFLHSLLGEISSGTTIMIEEDKNTTHSYTFIKTFIAQNIHHDIAVISKDYDKIKIPDYNTAIKKDRDEKLQIAFRYENLKLQNNEKRFDFNKEMNVSDKNIRFVKLDKDKNCVLDILSKLAPNTIVVLPSFLSPVWHINNLSYIYDIKQIVKRNKLVLVATIPTFLYNDTPKLYFDVILSLQTFPFTNKLANYSGIIELKKVYNLDKCKEHTFDALKYGYYATKHGLEFEDISLPPDENELNGCSVGSMF